MFLYDDSVETPSAIRQIIGVERFSALLRRKRYMSEAIAALVEPVQNVRFVHAIGREAAVAQIEALEQIGAEHLVLWMPSSLAPLDFDKFGQLIRKLPYAPGPALFGPVFGDNAVTLMNRHEAVALLQIAEARDRRLFLQEFAGRALQVENVSGITDLRDVGAFLSFMTGATEARHFNSMSVSGGIYRKSSADIDKMRAEYSFFHIAPERMKRFLLPTFDFEERDGRASYSMEKMSVPDAALQIVHHSFTPESFDQLLAPFFDFLAARARKQVGRDQVRDAARAGFVDKLDRRLAQFTNSEAGRDVDALLRGCGPMGGVAELHARTKALMAHAIARDDTDHLAIGHGDPCLSNILFNRDLGLFRLIDPRGAVSIEEGWMHPLYDLAKFTHSVLGGYDFVNNGLFECQLDADNRLTLLLDNGGPPDWMRRRLRERIAAAGHDLWTVRAYELSLFMSLLPLHVDVRRKLPAFCLIAGDIITELESQL